MKNSYNSLQKTLDKLSYSGDNISVLEDSTGRYICKVFSDPKKGRLSIQKQQQFEHFRSENWNLSSPKILQTIESDEAYSVIMEYIHGYSGGDLDAIDTIDLVSRMKECLSSFISNNIENSREEKIPSRIFEKKILEIKEKCSNDYIFDDRYFMSAIDHVNKKSHWIMPIGYNHGDLTLTNIIATGRRQYYLIDFLPSFLETPLWDVAKAYQDLALHWSARRLSGPQKMNFKLMANAVKPKILDIAADFYSHSFEIILYLCLLRICPYINDEPSNKWLCYNLEKFNLR